MFSSRFATPCLTFMIAGILAGWTGATCASPLAVIEITRGDTLGALCVNYLETPDRCLEIARINHVKNPDRIYAGKSLAIPVEMLKGVPSNGQVTFTKGKAVVESSDGSRKRLVATGDTLVEGERLVTGSDGIVEITFDDGTVFRLQPDSSIVISRSRNKGGSHYLRDLFLGSGRIITRIKKATGREQRFNIRTPSAVAGARGTEFRVAVDAQEATRAETLEGTVGLAAAKAEVILHGGEGSLARKGEAPLPPRRLLPPPSPVSLPPVFKSEPARLRFTPVPDAVAYRILLARDREIKDVVRNTVIKPEETLLVSGLEDGIYHLESRSIDTLGLEGMPSPPDKVTIRQNPFPPHSQSPNHGARLRERKVVFRWLKVADAAKYRLQVIAGNDISAPLLDTKVEGESYPVDELPFGDYAFRVASIAVDGYEGEWSDPVNFTIIPPPPVPAMEKPEMEGKEIRIRVKDAGASFSYQFQVATDRDFASSIVDRTGKLPELSIMRPEEPGTYFVRSRCIGPDGFAGNFTPPQSFEIERKFPFGALGFLGIFGLILGLAL